jgi:hypothetical protein
MGHRYENSAAKGAIITYRYPRLRLDPSFGSSCNFTLTFCIYTPDISIYVFHLFFLAENDAEDK